MCIFGELVSRTPHPAKSSPRRSSVGEVRGASTIFPTGNLSRISQDLLFEGCGALPRDIEYCKTFLKENPTKRLEFVRNWLEAYIARRRQDGQPLFDPQCWV